MGVPRVSDLDLRGESTGDTFFSGWEMSGGWGGRGDGLGDIGGVSGGRMSRRG